MAGGFRMGPFELMDLVGIDVGLEVAKSFDEQSFGEPRWRPNPLQARMVAAGRLGRKTGRGWYEYPRENDDPEPPGGTGAARARILGDSPVAEALRERAEDDPDADLVIDCEGSDGDVVLCADRSLGSRARCGFHLLPPLGTLVELTGERDEAVEAFFRACGLHPEWVGDAPGLVLGRIVCQLVNEAAFAIGEGVGSEADVDTGMTLGLNHPRGPMEWGRLIGFERVLATIDGLFEDLREPRYRAAPLLRRILSVSPP
jgi:3-hydroxybutyryl-CoA dehydrogenase